MIDYTELFRQHFNPTISLLDKIKERIPNLKNRIQLNEQLNEFAKENVYNIISGKYEQKSNLRANIPLFMPNSYFEFLSEFQFQFNDTKENLKNAILNATLNDLDSKNFLEKLSNQNIDIIGLYLFITKKGSVVCSINCAQLFLDEPFSPESFLRALKERGDFSNDISIDSELQKAAEEIAPKFEDCDYSARHEFETTFNDKFSYNSAYYRFTVPSNQNMQIINLIFSNPSLIKFFEQRFDKIGFALFHVGDELQLLVIISNSQVKPSTNSNSLSEFVEDDSVGEIDDNDVEFVETNTTSPIIPESQALKLPEESDDDTTASDLMKYDKSKQNPIPPKQTSEISSNLDISIDEEEEEIFKDLSLLKFNKPELLSLDASKNRKMNDGSDYSSILSNSPIISSQSISSNQTDKKDDNDVYDDDLSDLSELRSPQKVTLSLNGTPVKTQNSSPDKNNDENNNNDDDDNEFSDLQSMKSPQKPLLNLDGTPIKTSNSPLNKKFTFTSSPDQNNDENNDDDDDNEFSDLQSMKSPQKPLLNLDGTPTKTSNSPLNKKFTFTSSPDQNNDENNDDDDDNEFSDLQSMKSPQKPLLNLDGTPIKTSNSPLNKKFTFNSSPDKNNDENNNDDDDNEYNDIHSTKSPQNASLSLGRTSEETQNSSIAEPFTFKSNPDKNNDENNNENNDDDDDEDIY